MLLAIDVGNTNTAIGIFQGETLKHNWSISTQSYKTTDEIGMLLLSMFRYANEDIEQVNDVIICSVVPHVMRTLTSAVKKYIHRNPIVVGPGVKTGINIKYEDPREVGADKIVNAVSAIKLYGAPVIVVDFGTATTFCAVNANKDYLGGVICPGIKISAEALFAKASKLPRVEIIEPVGVIGKNTVTSIQSGLFFGYLGQVEYIVKKMKDEMKEDNIMVVATGGFAEALKPHCRCVDEVNGLLTLTGLKEIYLLNKNNRNA